MRTTLVFSSSDSSLSSDDEQPVVIERKVASRGSTPQRQRTRQIRKIEEPTKVEKEVIMTPKHEKIDESVPSSENSSNEIKIDSKEKEKLKETKQLSAPVSPEKNVKMPSDGFESTTDKQNYPSPSEFTQYLLVRDKSMTWRGKRTHFQLYKNGEPILHSKVKANDEIVYFAEGTEMHFKDVPKHTILSHDDHFSLREGGETGKEIIHISYGLMEDKKNMPRVIQAKLFNKDDESELLRSRKPKRIEHFDGWVLNLSGRSGLKSIKNCVMLNKDNKEKIIITKKDKNTLSIEAGPEYSDEIVFTFGVSSFLCRK